MPHTSSPAEADVRFLGYRLEVISHWPASPRKTATAEAISQRLTSIARCALNRPDILDLLNLSCQLLDNFFAPPPQLGEDKHTVSREFETADVYQ